MSRGAVVSASPLGRDALPSLGRRASDRDAPVRLVVLAGILGHRYGAASSRRDQEVDEALARGEETGTWSSRYRHPSPRRRSRWTVSYARPTTSALRSS